MTTEVGTDWPDTHRHRHRRQLTGAASVKAPEVGARLDWRTLEISLDLPPNAGFEEQIADHARDVFNAETTYSDGMVLSEVDFALVTAEALEKERLARRTVHLIALQQRVVIAGRGVELCRDIRDRWEAEGDSLEEQLADLISGHEEELQRKAGRLFPAELNARVERQPDVVAKRKAIANARQQAKTAQLASDAFVKEELDAAVHVEDLADRWRR